jgi:uncharacterized membrane-anchored protein
MTVQRRIVALCVIAGLQVFFVLGVVGAHVATTRYGDVVRMATIPVDPRDIFFGDYVTLRFAINQFSPQQWKGAALPQKGEVVYANMRPVNGLLETIYFSHTPSDISFKGVITEARGDQFEARYGIERYYVREGTGAVLEQIATTGQAIATIRMAPWGQFHLESIAPRTP